MPEFEIASERIITVFGGSGFLGRYVVRALAQRGWRIRVATRRPDLAFHLQPLGRVGQIHAVQANVRYPASLAAAMRGSDAVVNLVGILTESGLTGPVDFPAAAASYKEAALLGLASAQVRYGFALLQVGRVNDALAQNRRARERDPLSAITVGMMAYVLSENGIAPSATMATGWRSGRSIATSAWAATS